MARNVERGLAGRIFQLKKQGSFVAPSLLASARRILENKNSEADVQAIREFLGVKRGGGGAAARGARELRGTISAAGRMATLAATVSSGGMGGALAAGALAQDLSKIAASLVKSPAFTATLTRVLASRPVARVAAAMTGRAAEQVRADAPLMVMRAGYAARRGLRVASAAVGLASIGAQLTREAVRGGDVLAADLFGKGRVESERLRELESDLVLAEARGDTMEPRILKMQIAAESRQRRASSVPIVGGLLGQRVGRKFALEAGHLELERDLRQSGRRVHTSALRDLARKRVLADEYGETGGKVMGRVEDALTWAGMGSSALEQKTTEAAKATLERARRIAGEGHALAARGISNAAQRMLDEANKEWPGFVSAWESPQNIWKAAETARQAEHWWAAQQMTRAGPRTGD